jgi:hypothetical protein
MKMTAPLMTSRRLWAGPTACVDEGRTVISPHPIPVYMENSCRERKWRCKMTVRPSSRPAAAWVTAPRV